ncbi:TIGR02206 family membrane protein [Paenibacillus sp. GCM10012306]|uniref:YwaF family protein n=1 Tax=Paenibacillus sp. GCM10012306 TaxID=3317342 RepID=UPI00360FCE92
MAFPSFFEKNRTDDFLMFSLSHWIALALVVLVCLLLYGGRFAIRHNSRLQMTIRLLLVVILLGSEAGLQSWYVSQGIWRSGSSLPLELCGITLLLSVVMLLTRNRMLYGFLYFAGIGGASIALLTPNLVYPFPHFRFLLFFISHGAIILASLYMTWVEGFRPSWKSLSFTMLCLNLVAACVWVANFMLGSNYMFLMRKPNTYSVLDYFGPYPYYLLVEELFAFAVFLCMYLVFFWLPARIKSRNQRMNRLPH